MALRILAGLANVWLTSVPPAAATAGTELTADAHLQEEQQLGTETFNELKVKREIISKSPLYDSLQPLANDIARAAQPRYGLPITPDRPR